MFGALIRAAGSVGSKLVRGSVTAGRGVANNSLVKSTLKQTALGGALYAAGNAITGRSSGMPALPAGGLPAFPSTMGSRGVFSNDANVPAMLKEWTISKGDLKFYPRAPKGFVICYDEKGDPFAIPKKIAMMLKMWRPAKKPPISVGDWQAVKRADKTVKKMKKIFSVTTHVDKNINGGKVRVTRRKKGGQ
jgi:hypothetical protein